MVYSFKIYHMEALVMENYSILQHILPQDVHFKNSAFTQVNPQGGCFTRAWLITSRITHIFF